jgi:hypothetical protein
MTGIVAFALTGARPAQGHELLHRVVLGPEAGVSLNGDQWIVGAFSRLDGLCVLACSRNLSIAVHALAGIGGNVMTVRGSPRLGYTFWLAEEDTVGIEIAAGGGIIGFIPVGGFAEFCSRTELRGCGGTHVGAEFGGGVRLWPFHLGAIAATGELPVVTVTLALQFPIWDERS